MDSFLNPIYAGLSRTAINEAETRYGPFALGAFIGMFAFVLYLGRVVHHTTKAT